jgi:hypothetical protein
VAKTYRDVGRLHSPAFVAGAQMARNGRSRRSECTIRATWRSGGEAFVLNLIS